MLHVDDLSRRYGRRWALIHVSLQVQAGKGCMLVGPNGSGKSTLIKCLATALSPHRGAITLDGRPLWSDRSELRRHIAYLGHQPHVYDDLSAQENLDVWARLAGMRPSDVDVDGLLRRVGLDPSRHDPVRTFSAGMGRRIALARMLLKSPKLVLLDEPFTALDPPGRELMISVANELLGKGAALVMATHLPAVASRVCDQALALESGKVTYDGPASGLPPLEQVYE
jgi:heme exporter protein A